MVSRPLTLVRPDMKKMAAIPSRATSSRTESDTSRSTAAKPGMTPGEPCVVPDPGRGRPMTTGEPCMSGMSLRGQRSEAPGRFDPGAGPGLDQLECVALVIDPRGPGATGARSGLAVVLA